MSSRDEASGAAFDVCASLQIFLDLVDFLVVDTEIGGDHLRIGSDARGIAIGDLAAIVEDDDVVGDLHDDAHVVLDEQDRDAVLVADRAQKLVELGRFAGIEAGRRLV